MDWVMNPSPGDALVCCVKNCGVLAENKRLRRRQLLPTTTLAAFFGCDTRALPLLISCRSVLVLAASSCGSADLQVFASAGAAVRLNTSQRREHCRCPNRTDLFPAQPSQLNGTVWNRTSSYALLGSALSVVRLSFHHIRLGGSCYSPTTRIRLI